MIELYRRERKRRQLPGESIQMPKKVKCGQDESDEDSSMNDDSNSQEDGANLSSEGEVGLFQNIGKQEPIEEQNENARKEGEVKLGEDVGGPELIKIKKEKGKLHLIDFGSGQFSGNRTNVDNDAEAGTSSGSGSNINYNENVDLQYNYFYSSDYEDDDDDPAKDEAFLSSLVPYLLLVNASRKRMIRCKIQKVFLDEFDYQAAQCSKRAKRN